MKYEKLRNSAYEGEKFETLKSGNVLLEIKRRFLENPNKDMFVSLVDCLTDSLVYIPMNAIISEKNAEIMKNSKVGDEVQLAEDLRMVPDYLQDPEGKLYLPIFTQEEQVDKEYHDQFSGVWIHISEAIDLYRHPREKLSGIILDAQTQPYIFTENMIKVIEDIMELKEHDLEKE